MNLNEATLHQFRVLRISLVVLAAAVGFASAASAEGEGFVEGRLTQNTMLCPATGFAGPAASTWVSYFADPAIQLPSTGDVAYMRATVWNISPCLNDTSGFFFTLPEGATLAVSTHTPVLCFLGNAMGFQTVTGTTSTTSCRQTPQVTASGMDFGFSQLAPGFFFEIRIPVSYIKWQGSLRPEHQLRVMTTSHFGTLFPSVAVAVNFRPKFENHCVTTSDAFNATVGFDLTHYYSTAFVDILYSTDPTFTYGPEGGHDVPQTYVQQTSQTWTNPALLAHPGSTATLTNLLPATTYYWKVRTGGGTTYTLREGPVQSFITPGASLVRPKPPVVRPPSGC